MMNAFPKRFMARMINALLARLLADEVERLTRLSHVDTPAFSTLTLIGTFLALGLVGT